MIVKHPCVKVHVNQQLKVYLNYLFLNINLDARTCDPIHMDSFFISNRKNRIVIFLCSLKCCISVLGQYK